MQDKTELQDNIYKELHLIRANFTRIKKHEMNQDEVAGKKNDDMGENVPIFLISPHHNEIASTPSQTPHAAEWES